MTIEKIAEELHNMYEEKSKELGLKIQENCRVKFDDLPKENKQLMLYIAEQIKESWKYQRKLCAVSLAIRSEAKSYPVNYDWFMNIINNAPDPGLII